MKHFFSLFLFFSLPCLLAQNPVFSWAKNMPGNNNIQEAANIAVDVMGNVYTSIVFSGTVDLDPGPGSHLVGNSVFGRNLAIVKLDANGTFIWGNFYDGGQNIQCTGLEVDGVGNVYVVGGFEDTVDFDPGPGVHNLIADKFNSSSYVFKLRPNGTLSWAYTFNGDNDCNELDIDNQANIFLTGSYSDSIVFNPGTIGFKNTTPGNSMDAYVVKIDSSGSVAWAGRFISSLVALGITISTDSSGFVFVSGGFRGTTDFDPGAGVYNVSSTGVTNNQFLTKLDNNGNFIYVRTWNSHLIREVAVDNQGKVNIAMLGLSSIVDLDPGPGIYTINCVSTEFALLQLDVHGNFKWGKPVGSTADMRSVKCDSRGNIYGTGPFRGLIDLDLGPGTYTALAGQLTWDNSYILNTDSMGNFLWAGIMSVPAQASSHSAMSNDLVLDNYGGIYTCGNFKSTAADLDPTGGTFFVSGLSDCYVNKLSRCIVSNITDQSLLTYCAPGATTLFATGPSTISWYSSPTSSTTIGTGTTFVTPLLSAGSYTYYVEASQCFGNFARTPVVVNVSPYPTVQVVSSLPVLCVGEVATIQLTGAAVYSVNGLASLPTFTIAPFMTTTLVVIGSNPGNCTGTTTYVQQTAICTGVNEENAFSYSIRPNPVSDRLYVDVKGATQVTIFSLSGQEVFQSRIAESESIDVNQLAAGVYIVQIVDDQNVVTQLKMVKN